MQDFAVKIMNRLMFSRLSSVLRNIVTYECFFLFRDNLPFWGWKESRLYFYNFYKCFIMKKRKESKRKENNAAIFLQIIFLTK